MPNRSLARNIEEDFQNGKGDIEEQIEGFGVPGRGGTRGQGRGQQPPQFTMGRAGESEREAECRPLPPLTWLLYVQRERRNDSLMRPMTAAIVLRQECRRPPLHRHFFSRSPEDQLRKAIIITLPSFPPSLLSSSLEMEA